MLHHLCGVCGRGGHDIPVRCEPGGRTIVHDETVLAQHQAVTCLANRQSRECVDVNAVEEGGRIRALDVDLAQSRHITDPYTRSDRLDLPRDGVEPVVVARSSEPLRTEPIAGLHKSSATLHSPGMS